jgi:cytochrome c-type biogenesis protein CcmH
MNATTLALMALLALVAGGWLTRPLWRKTTTATVRRKRANVTAYETRVAEIDADLAAGALDAESAQQLRDEAGSRLLHDADTAAADRSADTPRRARSALLLIAVLGIGTALAYWLAGSWQTRGTIELAQRDPQAAEQQMIAGMIAKLETRLKATPDDAQGWAMLGRSYVVTQRYGDAAKAYARANALSIEQPQADWLVAAGAAQGLASPERDLRASRPLFEQALTLDPGNAEALWYGGLAALQSGDMATAYRHWLALRDQDLPEDIADVLEQQLPLLAVQAGAKLPPKRAAAAPASEAAAPAASAASLTVNVRIADALRDKIKPGMTLLVFAKADNGPPMPLAVQRIEAPQLPLTVTLDDSMAMMPAMKLSGFERWVVTARLTASGGAQALSGDLEGRHAASRADAGTPLELVIDQQLP